ncbi:MAG: hypothetical protein ACO21B_01100, partial [Gemmobacter sp.]
MRPLGPPPTLGHPGRAQPGFGPPRRMGPPQEVTQDVFDTWLAPLLAAHGFAGSYTQKTGSSAIGCATFVAAR